MNETQSMTNSAAIQAAGGLGKAWWPKSSAAELPDSLEQLAWAEAADMSLLRLVGCSAAATLGLALIARLV